MLIAPDGTAGGQGAGAASPMLARCKSCARTASTSATRSPATGPRWCSSTARARAATTSRHSSAAPFRVLVLPAGCPRARRDPLGRRRGVPLRVAHRGRAGVRRRPAAGHVPPARVLDGRGDRARAGGPCTGAAPVPRARQRQRRARTSGLGRAATFDPERLARDEPAWADDLAAATTRSRARAPGGACSRRSPRTSRTRSSGRRRARGIRCPTLVMVGDRDPFVPVEQAVRLRRTIRDARLLVAPGCGHEVLRRRPAIAREALASFYRRWDPLARRYRRRDQEAEAVR